MAGSSAYGDAISGLPACASAGQLNCVSKIAGGETGIVQSFYQGSSILQVYGDLNSGQTVYLTPGVDGTSGTDPVIQAQVTQADAVIMQFARYSPLPPCANFTTSYCYATNAGGTYVISASSNPSYVYIDTPISQRVDQYQTTIQAKLNGNQTVFQESFALAAGDPAVQAAIQQADGILAADNAAFGSPILASNLVSLESSQLTYVQTGPAVADGNSTETDSTIFGPTVILVGPNETDPFLVAAGQTDVNLNTATEYDVPQNAVTTDTYMTTQTYDIDGTTAASPIPEPGSWMLMIGGLGAIAAGWLKRLRRGRACKPFAFCAFAIILAALPRLAHSQPLTTAAITDPTYGVKAFTVTLPVGWRLQGTVLEGPACNQIPYAVLRAYAADGLTEMRRFPRFDWVFYPNSKFKGPADCLSLGRPYTPAEFLDHFMEVLGGGNGIRYVGPMNVSPQVRERVQHLADALNQNNRAPGFHASSEVAAIRVRTANGTFVVEQRLTAWVECRQRSGGKLQGGGCSATVDVLRAPKGKLDALAQLVDSHDLTKLVHDDQWLQRVMLTQQQRGQEQLAALQRQAARGNAMLRQQYEQFNATMQRNHEAFMAQQQSRFESSMRNANASMNARSTVASDWVDYALDQQTVTGSGGTVKISNAYTQTWSNGQGQWFQTNDPNTNPNGVLSGNWTPQTKVHGNGTPQ